MRKFLLSFLTAILCMVSLCGCQEKTLDEAQITSDIPEYFMSVNTDGEWEYVPLQSFTIRTRDTNEERDIVYADAVWENDSYRLSAECNVVYWYRDDQGWVLSELYIPGDIVWSEPLKYIPVERAQSYISQFYTNPQYVDTAWRKEQPLVSHTFYVEEAYENCTYSGDIDVSYQYTYSVERDGSGYTVMNHWSEALSNASRLDYSWNINDVWLMEDIDSWGDTYNYFAITEQENQQVSLDFESYYAPKHEEANLGDVFSGNVDVNYDYSLHTEPKLNFRVKVPGDYYDVYFTRDSAKVEHNGFSMYLLCRSDAPQVPEIAEPEVVYTETEPATEVFKPAFTDDTYQYAGMMYITECFIQRSTNDFDLDALADLLPAGIEVMANEYDYDVDEFKLMYLESIESNWPFWNLPITSYELTHAKIGSVGEYEDSDELEVIGCDEYGIVVGEVKYGDNQSMWFTATCCLQNGLWNFWRINCYKEFEYIPLAAIGTEI